MAEIETEVETEEVAGTRVATKVEGTQAEIGMEEEEAVVVVDRVEVVDEAVDKKCLISPEFKWRRRIYCLLICSIRSSFIGTQST